MSVGDRDIVRTALGTRGDVGVWSVAMQPGKPFAFGDLGGVPFFGLAGNPVATAVSFEQLARPAILAIMGHTAVFRPRVPGVIEEPVTTNPAKTVFVRVVTRAVADGPVQASLSGSRRSDALASLAVADAFAVVPAGVGDLAGGARVDLELFTAPGSRSRLEAGV